jgi:hypothetical protein
MVEKLGWTHGTSARLMPTRINGSRCESGLACIAVTPIKEKITDIAKEKK